MTILPNDIPEDTAPLSDLPAEPSTTRLPIATYFGKNVFVTLLTGETLVGLLEPVKHDVNLVSIGIHQTQVPSRLIEAIREV
jgi:hypothetical protein